MGTPYPLEKKNQILGRILSKEITVEHRRTANIVSRQAACIVGCGN